MRKTSFIFTLCILMAFLAICSAIMSCSEAIANNNKTDGVKPKNIIFLIGDGMGLTQITAGMIINDNKLQLERFKHIGLIKTHASDDLITDSAASATAYACGIKTYNGAIGVDDNRKPVKTILEYAEDAGLSTGLVATSVITHATPASFIAHQDSRKKYEEIAEDFTKTPVDYIAGGGRKHFSMRADSVDLAKTMEANGYNVTGRLERKALTSSDKIAWFKSLDHVSRVSQGRGDFLEQAALMGYEFLDSKNTGYFIMVESSQIDWGGHANDSDYIVEEMLDFNTVIGKTLDYAKADGETLVVLTADHETGGYAINKAIFGIQDSLQTGFTTGYHTGTMVPVFAYGPGAENFTGIFENTEVFYKMMDLLNLKENEGN